MKQDRISDLEELVLCCRTDAARDYIKEATSAYKAGAYRASIVTTWVAVVYDIIDKIRELAISGDKRANRLLTKFENFQKNIEAGDKSAIDASLKFERGILEVARDEINILDGQQFVDLNRLREDRNRCAHPTFQRVETPYAPTAEQARYHIKNSIIHVLQMPPVQGKQALENLIKLVESKYFPKEKDDAISQLAESDLSRPSNSLVNAFVDKLLHCFFDSESVLCYQRRVVVALQACLHMHHNITLSRIGTQLSKCIIRIDDKDLKFAVALLKHIPESWDYLNEPSQIKLIEFTTHCDDEQFSNIAFFTINVQALRLITMDRINNLEAKYLSAIIQKGVRGEAVERAVNIFSTVRNWHAANYAEQQLISPLFDLLTPEHIEIIIKAKRDNGADLPGSTGFYRFLRRVTNDKVMATQDLTGKLEEYGLGDYANNLDFLTEEEVEPEEDLPF